MCTEQWPDFPLNAALGWWYVVFVYQLGNSDLAVEIFFEKEGTVEWGDINFEIEGWGTFRRACLLFNYFFCDKKEELLKTFLTCSCMPWLLNSFDFPSYGSELRKIYTKAIVDVYRGWSFGVALPGGKWLACGNGFTGGTGGQEETVAFNSGISYAKIRSIK